jgi:mono/diheme cytochrome c family protein
MVRSGGLALLAALLCSTATVEAAGGKLDVSAGRDLAKRWCGECHDVTPAARSSPNASAPTFGELTAMPGFTEMSARAMLRNEHLTMPPFEFTAEQIDDIVGYLVSLAPAR